jgi:hypothetical protein
MGERHNHVVGSLWLYVFDGCGDSPQLQTGSFWNDTAVSPTSLSSIVTHRDRAIMVAIQDKATLRALVETDPRSVPIENECMLWPEEREDGASSVVVCALNLARVPFCCCHIRSTSSLSHFYLIYRFHLDKHDLPW